MSRIRHVTLLGCGRLGSALVEGWRLKDVVSDLTVLTRALPPVCPPETQALVVAVKPAVWRAAVAPLTVGLPSDAIVISVMAGVRAADISEALGGRVVARVMPTTAVAQGQGVAAVWAPDPAARALAHGLFDPIADAVDLETEALLDPATAVAGSAPAFFYALAQALASAGAKEGLPPNAADRLVRGALRSAASGAATPEGLDALIARIASPGGTTRAGLEALDLDQGLTARAEAAVRAATARARALSSGD